MSKSKGKSKKVKDFEPNILVFCCNWCSYAGADLAGVSRFQYHQWSEDANFKTVWETVQGKYWSRSVLKMNILQSCRFYLEKAPNNFSTNQTEQSALTNGNISNRNRV